MLISFTLGFRRFRVHHTADRVLLFDEVLHGRCGMNKRFFRSDLFCVSDKGDEHSRFIKIVTQLSCRDCFGAVECEIGQSSSALLDGDTTAKKFFCKVLEADCIGECLSDSHGACLLSVSNLVCLNWQALFRQSSVFLHPTQAVLSSLPNTHARSHGSYCRSADQSDTDLHRGTSP